jgi:two-component system, NtrC family, response regulator HydG
VTNAGHPPAHYRLRGEVGGASRSYPLRPGDNWVGSTSANAVVLPLRGVSRRHARLTLDLEGLTLEDMGSKNGTLVKGVRVQRTRLQAGDEIRIGPVTLHLEEVAPEDTMIAIRIGTGHGPVTGLPAADTTATGTDEPGRVNASLLERVIARACEAPEPDLADLVALLRRELGAESVCLFEVQKGEPVALATCGPVPDLARHEAFRLFVDEGTASGAFVRAASLQGDPPLACAVAAGTRGQESGLVAAGGLRFPHAEVEAVLRVVLSLLQRLRPRALAPAPRRRAEIPALAFPEGYVPGESAAIRSCYAQMRPAAQGDVPVLLLGETGVGKEVLARTLHLSSPRRRSGPFVAVNCAAIPADLLEAEMFGIGRGVATGVAERRGKFQMAEGGTLLLDEIGDMPLTLQAKLLRALQEKEVQPVGGAPVAVDIRVVAATNSDLHRRMEDGRFRRDLYFRIAGFALHVPPLRERRDDVPMLVETFLRAAAREAAKNLPGITVKALRTLVDYAWPGNVRELEHEVRRLVYLCPDGEAIDATMLSPHVTAVEERPVHAPPPTLDLEKETAALERQLITEALRRSAGNRSGAARLLGISRNGLAIKMERLGLAAPVKGITPG